MDLAQAEAVADLIASKTKAAHDIAMNQMKEATPEYFQASGRNFLRLYL